MKYTVYPSFILMICLLFSCTSHDYTTHEKGISFEQNEISYTLEVFSPSIIRVLTLPVGDSITTKRLITDWDKALPVNIKTKSTKEKITLTTTEIKVEFDKKNQTFAFYERNTDRLLLQEAQQPRSFKRMEVAGDSGFGLLRAVRPSAQLARTPAGYARPSVPPGTDRSNW